MLTLDVILHALKVFLPLITGITVAFALVAMVASLMAIYLFGLWEYRRETASVSFSTTFVGIVVGHAAGLSREAVTGDILPVVITIIAGLVTISAVQRKMNIFVACSLATLFALAIQVGLTVGSISRELGLVQYSLAPGGL